MKHERLEAADVSRETGAALARLVSHHGLGAEVTTRLGGLLSALAAEPDPPTSVSGEAAIDVHIADSLAGLEVEELRKAQLIGDLGSGAGFPGLVLAAALPDAQVELVESARRKTVVIERLASAAAIPNARAITSRIEDWGAATGRERYGAVTARALGPLAVVLEYVAPLLRIGGTAVLWRGARDAAEETTAERAAEILGLELSAVVPVQPYAASRNRHLHLYSKVIDTPERFPRRAGIARKRPLST